MPITLQYGANPTVAMMAAYQGGKNAYRNKQEEEYRRLYMQQQQLQQQAQLQREHMGYQFLAAQGQMGFRADQQRKAIEAQQGIATDRLDADAANRWDQLNLERWKTQTGVVGQERVARIGAAARQKPELDDFGNPIDAAELSPKDGEDGLPKLPKEPDLGPRPKPTAPLAAYGLGGRPPATRQDRVTVAAQRQANARQTRMGYGVDFPMAAQGYLVPSTITHTEPAPYTGEKATYDRATGRYRAPRRKDWTSW